MNIITKFMTRNDCYTAGRKITPKGIMVHSTATPGVMAVDWYSRWNRSYKAGEISRQVCVHAFVDDKEVCQYLPWNHRGWHAGGNANNTHIGFEICEPKVDSKEYFDKAYANAVELAAYLCKQYKLTEKDIIGHCEGYKLGIASNHADPLHWFPKHGKSMDTFRADVKALLQPKPVKTGKVNARAGLNVRKGPSILHSKVTALAYNAQVKIYGESRGWYNVGAGWVSAKYVTITSGAAVTAPLPVPAPQPVYYVVKSGDSLTKIAVQYKTSISAICKLNPSIKNPNIIFPKQKIRVK